MRLDVKSLFWEDHEWFGRFVLVGKCWKCVNKLQICPQDSAPILAPVWTVSCTHPACASVQLSWVVVCSKVKPILHRATLQSVPYPRKIPVPSYCNTNSVAHIHTHYTPTYPYNPGAIYFQPNPLKPYKGTGPKHAGGQCGFHNKFSCIL